MSFTLKTYDGLNKTPLDVFERIALAEGYEYERQSLRELHLTARGRWSDHQIWVVWDKDGQTMRIFLAFDSRTPGRSADDIQRLISVMNERLPVGHFDLWREDGAIVYRYGLLINDNKVDVGQASSALQAAIDAGDRFYPAYQYVVWAGKSPEDAVDAALIEYVMGS